MIKITPKRVILSCVIAVLLAVAIVASVFAGSYWTYLMNVFGSSDMNLDSTKVNNALVLGDELVQEISEDSMVMLKNQNNALPLSEDERKVNLFGYGSTGNGWIYSGGGSSGTILNASSPSEEVKEELKITLSEAFEAEGFQVNKSLEKKYEEFSNYNATAGWSYDLYGPKSDFYSHELLREAIEFSPIAVVVISRRGNEESELPLTQWKYNGDWTGDNSRTYLQLTEEEEDMIDIVSDNFEKVIVLLNIGNPVETGFLKDDGIDAAFYAGMTGQSGTLAIPRLLKGYKTVEKEDGTQEKIAVTPSGRLADTYTYSLRQYNPTDANMFAQPRDFGQITYAEGIYVGYKWYETANAEGYFDSVDNEYGKGYDGVVQYPFGYGLSYGTDFEYKVETSLSVGSEITADTKISVKVTVMNSHEATATGKDVVQLYYTPEYYEGEIEKSEVNLLAFAKTANLAPGTEQTFTFEISPYDLACYDDYGKNPGEHTGYELDRGKYIISLRSDAHNVIDCANSELEYNVSETINIDIDPVTKNPVENRFTGSDAYMEMPIDGSTAGSEGQASITYLSRADFAGTFPTMRTPDRGNTALIQQVCETSNTRYDTDEQTVTGKDNKLYLITREDGTKASLKELSGEDSSAKLKYNDELVRDLGEKYDNPLWSDLLDQLTIKEMTDLVANGFFGTIAVESVGKPKRLDMDGPAGFHHDSIPMEERGKLVAYPSEALIGCSWNPQITYNMGRAQGVLANAFGINGWYGPGLNLHRNPFSGRYFEYYSEDPLLVGKLAAETIRGATNNGLYCYMKHFAASEEGVNPEEVKTWLTEQTLREIYLRPFEIATKEGGANAVMTAFNCIGAVWAGACDPMNNDILRSEWGFRGSIITDWSMGRAWMNGMRGIRGGNDLWLDSNEPFDTSATTVSLLRTATKNILYTFANTYARAKDYQENGDDDDRYDVEIGISITAAPFSPIPVLMVVGVWVLAGAASAVCVAFIVKKPKTV